MIRAALICLMMCPALLRAQIVALTRPENPHGWSTIALEPLDSTARRLSLPHNSPEVIRSELLDETLITKIGTAVGLSPADLSTICLVAPPEPEFVELFQLGAKTNAFESMKAVLPEYVRAREDGHTQECLLAGLTNRLDRAYTEHPSLRFIVDRHRLVPISRIKLRNAGTETVRIKQRIGGGTESAKADDEGGVDNSEGKWVITQEVRKWESYIHVDGDICWTYYLEFKPDGSLDYMVDAKRDAKDFDPKYKAVFEEVDKAVAEEMEKEGTAGKFGSCHRAWDLKKEKLREKGIDWLTPTEVDPGAIYD